LARQCELLGLARSSLYYQPRGESEENLAVMRRIDQLYTKWPFLGSRRMRVYLSRQGYEVNRKRVQRLMSLMGLEAIYPKRSLSRAVTGAKRYPYLLRGLEVASADEVWAADITYIRLVHGYLYVPGGGTGLVEPLRAGLGDLQHLGCGLLRRGLAPGVGAGAA